MKKTVKIILMVFFLCLLNNKIYSQDPDALSGDFGITGQLGYNTYAIIEAVSVPFEGITRPQTEYIQFNRMFQIQNGAYWRFFTNSNSHIEGNVAYITGSAINPGTSSTFLDLGHCSGYEYPNSNMNATWGFAKYKYTFYVSATNETYSFYFDYTDSKYG